MKGEKAGGWRGPAGFRGAGADCLDSQLGELLAELPGVRSDPADGVVGEVELLQSQQAVQPALIHLRQVVVVQLPAGPHKHKMRLYADKVPTEGGVKTGGGGRPWRARLQDFHVAEAPEGSVHQAAQAVALHLQRAQGVQAVERQTLHAADAVPAQLPVTHKRAA